MNYYKSEDIITISAKDVFTDKQGYPNEKAFLHFIQNNKDMFNSETYYLVCVTIDLEKANLRNKAYGDYVLRKLICSLEKFYIFRIQGEKFNICVNSNDLPALEKFLTNDNNDYDIYYGVVNKRLIIEKISDLDEYIHKGIELMYKSRELRKKEIDNGNIIGDKGNTPFDLRETPFRKFKSTMWYSNISIRIKEPVYKEFTLFVFPTEYKPPLNSLKTIVVVWSGLEYRVFYDTNIQFGTDGYLFNINTRFDREGHLVTAIYNISDNNNCDIMIDTHEGVGIPVNFGKRLNDNKELYPIQRNIKGYCDYVLIENEKVTLNTEGTFKTADGIIYGVCMDNTCIDIVRLESQRNERILEHEKSN